MNSEGIGMGLMICKSLVEKNGGTIEVFSNGADKGSVFTFTMKMTEHDEAAEQNGSSSIFALSPVVNDTYRGGTLEAAQNFTEA